MNLRMLSQAAFAAAALALPAFAGAQTIVNVDFNGQRNAPGPDADPTTFSGTGALGGGTVFNGVLVDSRVPGSTTLDNDNLAVSAVSLLDSDGNPTTVSFTVGPVGGDTAGGDPLTGDYIFTNSAGNQTGPAGAPIAISGLVGATTADLFVYGGGNNFVTINGSTGASPVTMNGFTGRFFDDVLVSGGSIAGSIADLTTPDAAETSVVPGFSVSFTPIPEPGVLSLLGLGSIGLLARRRGA